MAFRWLCPAFALAVLSGPPEVAYPKLPHSRRGFLFAPNNPRGGGLFHPLSSIPYPGRLRRSRPGSVPKAARAGRNKEVRERPNYESRSLKSQNRRPKLTTRAQDLGNERFTPQVPRFGRFPPFRRPPPQHRSPESDPRKPEPQPATGPAGNHRSPPPPAQEPPRCLGHAQTVTDRPANPVVRVLALFRPPLPPASSPRSQG